MRSIQHLRGFRIDVDAALCLAEWWRIAWPLVSHTFSGASSLEPAAQYAAVVGPEAQAAIRACSRRVRTLALLDSVMALMCLVNGEGAHAQGEGNHYCAQSPQCLALAASPAGVPGPPANAAAGLTALLVSWLVWRKRGSDGSSDGAAPPDTSLLKLLRQTAVATLGLPALTWGGAGGSVSSEGGGSDEGSSEAPHRRGSGAPAAQAARRGAGGGGGGAAAWGTARSAPRSPLFAGATGASAAAPPSSPSDAAFAFFYHATALAGTSVPLIVALLRTHDVFERFLRRALAAVSPRDVPPGAFPFNPLPGAPARGPLVERYVDNITQLALGALLSRLPSAFTVPESFCAAFFGLDSALLDRWEQPARASLNPRAAGDSDAASSWASTATSATTATLGGGGGGGGEGGGSPRGGAGGRARTCNVNHWARLAVLLDAVSNVVEDSREEFRYREGDGSGGGAGGDDERRGTGSAASSPPRSAAHDGSGEAGAWPADGGGGGSGGAGPSSVPTPPDGGTEVFSFGSGAGGGGGALPRRRSNSSPVPPPAGGTAAASVDDNTSLGSSSFTSGVLAGEHLAMCNTKAAAHKYLEQLGSHFATASDLVAGRRPVGAGAGSDAVSPPLSSRSVGSSGGSRRRALSSPGEGGASRSGARGMAPLSLDGVDGDAAPSLERTTLSSGDAATELTSAWFMGDLPTPVWALASPEDAEHYCSAHHARRLLVQLLEEERRALADRMGQRNAALASVPFPALAIPADGDGALPLPPDGLDEEAAAEKAAAKELERCALSLQIHEEEGDEEEEEENAEQGGGERGREPGAAPPPLPQQPALPSPSQRREKTPSNPQSPVKGGGRSGSPAAFGGERPASAKVGAALAPAAEVAHPASRAASLSGRSLVSSHSHSAEEERPAPPPPRAQHSQHVHAPRQQQQYAPRQQQQTQQVQKPSPRGLLLRVTPPQQQPQRWKGGGGGGGGYSHGGPRQSGAEDGGGGGSGGGYGSVDAYPTTGGGYGSVDAYLTTSPRQPRDKGGGGDRLPSTGSGGRGAWSRDVLAGGGGGGGGGGAPPPPPGAAASAAIPQAPAPPARIFNFVVQPPRVGSGGIFGGGGGGGSGGGDAPFGGYNAAPYRGAPIQAVEAELHASVHALQRERIELERAKLDFERLWHAEERAARERRDAPPPPPPAQPPPARTMLGSYGHGPPPGAPAAYGGGYPPPAFGLPGMLPLSMPPGLLANSFVQQAAQQQFAAAAAAAAAQGFGGYAQGYSGGATGGYYEPAYYDQAALFAWHQQQAQMQQLAAGSHEAAQAQQPGHPEGGPH